MKINEEQRDLGISTGVPEKIFRTTGDLLEELEKRIEALELAVKHLVQQLKSGC